MYKPPQLYHDLMRFYKIYWQSHQHLPKAFRQTTGESILFILTDGLGQVAAANLAGVSLEDRRQAAAELQDLRLGLEKVRAFLTLAWELKFISHPVMHDLGGRLDGLGRQTTRWRNWFGKGAADNA